MPSIFRPTDDAEERQAPFVRALLGAVAVGLAAQGSAAQHPMTPRGGIGAGPAVGWTQPVARAAASLGGSSEGRSKEYKVKAAVLFNFLKYAKFPKGTFESDKAPITILIVGKNPFGSGLQKLLGKKKIGARAIKVLHVEAIPKEPIQAQLVFTSGLGAKDEKRLIKDLAKKPVLLVGESDGFAERGAFINLRVEAGKVRFDINEACQKSTRIQLKAELLKLARIVKTTQSISQEGI